MSINPKIQVSTEKPKLSLEELVSIKLPPSPSGIMKLTELLRNANTQSREIAEAISFEPTLIGRILRLANSPLYSPVKPVISINGAINTIGTRAIYDILMVEMASATFAKEIRSSTLAKKIWEHSLAVAIIAREVGKVMDMRGLEEAFICGLLHDFGKFILVSYDSEGFANLLDKHDEKEMIKAEIEHFGFCHAEVGALVVQRWNLREEICETIRHHHNPKLSTQAMVITNIVDVADKIANSNGFGLRFESDSSLTNSESVAKLRLTEENLQTAWEKSLDSITEVMVAYH